MYKISVLYGFCFVDGVTETHQQTYIPPNIGVTTTSALHVDYKIIAVPMGDYIFECDKMSTFNKFRIIITTLNPLFT